MAFGVAESTIDKVAPPPLFPPKIFGVSSLPNDAGDKCIDVCCDLHMTNSIAGKNMWAKNIFTFGFLFFVLKRFDCGYSMPTHTLALALAHTIDKLSNSTPNDQLKNDSLFRLDPNDFSLPKSSLDICSFMLQQRQRNGFFFFFRINEMFELIECIHCAIARLLFLNHFLFITERIADRSSAFILFVACFVRSIIAATTSNQHQLSSLSSSSSSSSSPFHTPLVRFPCERAFLMICSHKILFAFTLCVGVCVSSQSI